MKLPLVDRVARLLYHPVPRSLLGFLWFPCPGCNQPVCPVYWEKWDGRLICNYCVHLEKEARKYEDEQAETERFCSGCESDVGLVYWTQDSGVCDECFAFEDEDARHWDLVYAQERLDGEDDFPTAPVRIARKVWRTKICAECSKPFQTHNKSELCYDCTLRDICQGMAPGEEDFNTAAILSGTLTDAEEAQLQGDLKDYI